MVYASLPGRTKTTRWRRAGNHTVALLDGLLALVGVALLVDSVRSFFRPDASLLGILVRWPGGRPLWTIDGALLGAAFLVRRRAAALVLVAHLALAVLNVAEYYVLRAEGLQGAALPFSFVTIGLLLGAIGRVLYDGPALQWRARLVGAVLGGPLVLLLHLLSFGATDYSRPAEAIVVFGARVYEDGSPSLALEDRVRHGVRLYRQGLAPRVVLSGGPDEVPVMAAMAIRAGVPREALELDPAGLNTHATLANLKERRIVAVSHYYHLARIKLTAQRLGISCATVPCAMSRHLAQEPYYLARECAAFVGYYLLRG
jgi:uncharacterized SAM-binding protein YcdF (DUF218 family)